MGSSRHPGQARGFGHKVNNLLLISFGKGVEVGNMGPLALSVGAGKSLGQEAHTKTRGDAPAALLSSNRDLVQEIRLGPRSRGIKFEGSEGAQSFRDFSQVGRSSTPGGSTTGVWRTSAAHPARIWRGVSRRWRVTKPSGTMWYIAETTKSITINNSPKVVDVTIGDSERGGTVVQGDLVTTLDRFGQCRVGGNNRECRQDVLEILVCVDSQVRVVVMRFPKGLPRDIDQHVSALH